MKHHYALWAVVLALAACVPAEDAANQKTDDAAADNGAPSARADRNQPASDEAADNRSRSSRMADAEIAHVAVTASRLDAEGHQSARLKTKNPEIRRYAEQMATEHTDADKEANEVTKRHGIWPADNPVSQRLQSDHARAKADLEAKSGAEYDRAYIAQEIKRHQNTLSELDQNLIPNAQNAELRSLLQKTRAVVDAHLKFAQHMQAKLAETNSPD